MHRLLLVAIPLWFTACGSDADDVAPSAPDAGGNDVGADAASDASSDSVAPDVEADAVAEDAVVEDAVVEDAGPPPPDPTAFHAAASLSVARSSHSATLLHDGRVLVVGGENVVTREPLDSVELFDPATESWSVGPSLPEPRSNHVAVLLEDGRVLVAGGGRSAPIGVPSGFDVLGSALLFDPSTDSWTPTGDLLEPRSHMAAVRLASGRVLVAGGGANTHEHGSTCNGYGVYDCGPIADTLGTTEIWDPSTGVFLSAAPMAEPRYLLTLTSLSEGRALAAAGANDAKESFATSEVFDESEGVWISGPDLASYDRLFHQAARLPSGKVLVGAGKKSNTTFLATVDVVDVDSGVSTATDSLTTPHTAGAFVVLASGRILSVGGFHCPNPCAPIPDAEIYDEATGVWTEIEPLATARSGHTATALQDGRVLVVGGYGNFGDLATCEIGE